MKAKVLFLNRIINLNEFRQIQTDLLKSEYL